MNRALLVLCALHVACSDSVTIAEPISPPPKRSMPVKTVPLDPALYDDDPGGIGVIETRTAAGDPGRLKLERVLVKATQAGDVADVTVEHTFMSESDAQLEGTFRFPLPDGAIVTGLSMLVDGKMMEGELVDNARARKIYQEIVDSMQDPAIMEWDHGSTFKMRVFPIEPHREKVVTLRYLAPLKQRTGAARFVQGTRAIDDETAIAELRVEWNGALTFDEKNVARDRIIEIPASSSSLVLSEDRADASYRVVHVRPDWSAVPATTKPAPKSFVVVVDTSRSALEERKLTLEALRDVLGGLGADTSFLIATSDLETTLAPGGWQNATHTDEARAFVENVTPDGATDLGKMLRVAGAAAKKKGDAAVIYLGDCEPSWGELDIARLTEQAKKSLGEIPFYPLLIGGSVEADVARELASATGGRTFRAQRAQDLTRFVTALRKSGKRLVRAELEPVKGSVVIPIGPTTIDEGEELIAYVRTPHGETPPASITLHAEAASKPISTVVKLDGSPAAFVMRRFGGGLVRSLEQAGAPKEKILEASLTYSVMSKHTSFLVLDSEEAYERYAIDRRVKQANATQASAPSIDALDPDAANISADRIQPGDPEIEIDAPRDAERVFVVLADGETKVAVYDEDANHGHGAWMVRFLVENGTPEGTYTAQIYIEHTDGRSETRSVTYTVDTTAPKLDVRITTTRSGRVDLHVRQLGPRGQIDTRRVEALTPDGQVIVLEAVRWGVFLGHWKPTRVLVPGEVIHFVGVDQALNHTTLDVAVP